MSKPRRSPKQTAPLKFDKRLVLNQWLLTLFEVNSLEELAEGMKDTRLEGLDENNISRFYHFLSGRLFERKALNKDVLLQYDQNIISHSLKMSGKREPAVTWKYFQYLALLFTEIYLDRYFRDPLSLLQALNAHVVLFNTDKAAADKVDSYKLDDLKKLAFWNATGSGKTLLMHVNILQYRHYLQLHGRERELNRIILLTPNEGLSKQHLQEFAISGLSAELFSKDGGTLFAGKQIEIIDIHKLKDEMGDKTVAIDAFEGNNLVLVDEGHRGSSGVEWKSKRDKLCESGFSFEYSATFGQAMKAAGKADLIQEYAKCILFDYSYKYFYHDDYGKDYRILNLADDRDKEVRRLYLTACLLSFYQQQCLFIDKEQAFAPYLIEKPLWVFVGGSVNAVRTEKGQTVSDVVDILQFLSEFIGKKAQSTTNLEKLLGGKPGVLDQKQNEIFEKSFVYLSKKYQNGDDLYRDILKTLFNCSTLEAVLHVENLKGVGGEIGLRAGDNDHFGVINVGDDSALVKLCEANGLSTTDKEFSTSLFHKLNEKHSAVNILIGSKKFTEGWSSWRVSTMGLMNVGKKEGSEIIQLFGRGVRLKGYGFTLKRSRPIFGNTAPQYIEVLETLNIFGVRADYMQQFRAYLEEEGLPSNDDRDEFILPVLKNLTFKQLNVLRLKDGMDFKKQGKRPSLDIPPEYIKHNKVVLDWYPIVQAMQSAGTRISVDTATIQKHSLTEEHIAFMNMDEVYFALQKFKSERAWYNLNLSKEDVVELLKNPSWYELHIPADELIFSGFSKVRRWQEIAVALLKEYCNAYYKYRKSEWELPHLEYQELKADDPNIVTEYRFLLDKSEEEVLSKLEQLKVAINSGKLKELNLAKYAHGRFTPINFDRHIYAPLIHIAKATTTIEVMPVHLNEGERDFVLHLQEYAEKNKEFFNGKELYLLRNQSKGRGIGFFEANNFYPDFIMWLVAADKQYVTFIDPKGLRNMSSYSWKKIEFAKVVKDIENRLGDPTIVLNSFIISTTPYADDGLWKQKMTKAEFEDCHVFFQEDAVGYIKKMMGRIV